MKATTESGRVAIAAARAEEELRSVAPELVDGFRAHLPRAVDVVSRRLVGAVLREGVADATWRADRATISLGDGATLAVHATRHGFGRAEVADTLTADPAELLRQLLPAGAAGSAEAAEEAVGGLAAELVDAVTKLALAYARPTAPPVPDRTEDAAGLVIGLEPDVAALTLERLATEGHNLHPCGRTRLGWDMADALAHDLETPGTELVLVAVDRRLHIGNDVGPYLGPAFGADVDPGRFAVTPVHRWQWERVIRDRYADLVREGALRRVGSPVPARPTAALRTLLLPGGRYVKVSLDIQVTSTRRSISVASTHNGPILSDLLSRILDDTGAGERVVLMTETAGSAATAGAGRDRDLAAIVRTGLAGRLTPDEVPVPGSALGATSPVTGRAVVAELVDRFARVRGLTGAAAAEEFLTEYARLLLVPVLTLAVHGIGFEAHLQNSVPTFVDGVPHRLGLRDLAGLRLYPPRLGSEVALWPGSVVATADLDVMRAKFAYTALQAHLGEIVLRLGADRVGLDEERGWARVRAVVDEIYETLGAAGRDDHIFLTAPTVPHKALLRMRLRPGTDIYVRVENPLR